MNKNLPVLGLGTCFATGDEMYHAVKHAIKIGYRHIDLAPRYDNQKEIGKAISECIFEKIVTREELIITSKLYHTCHQPVLVKLQLEEILKETGLEYLDYFMMHSPWAFKPKFEDKITCEPLEDKYGAVVDQIDYLETWKAMLKCENVRFFATSNFNSKQLCRLITETGYTPKINQVECHVLHQQPELLEFCKAKGIQLQAYAPLGEMRVKGVDGKHVLENDVLKEISRKHSASVAQVILRYHCERGVATIPKSKTFSRIEENFESLEAWVWLC